MVYKLVSACDRSGTVCGGRNAYQYDSRQAKSRRSEMNTVFFGLLLR